MMIYRGSDLIPVGYTYSILCQTWILENQLPSMCSQGLGAHRIEISLHKGDSTAWRRRSH